MTTQTESENRGMMIAAFVVILIIAIVLALVFFNSNPSTPTVTSSPSGISTDISTDDDAVGTQVNPITTSTSDLDSTEEVPELTESAP